MVFSHACKTLLSLGQKTNHIASSRARFWEKFHVHIDAHNKYIGSERSEFNVTLSCDINRPVQNLCNQTGRETNDFLHWWLLVWANVTVHLGLWFLWNSELNLKCNAPWSNASLGQRAKKKAFDLDPLHMVRGQDNSWNVTICTCEWYENVNYNENFLWTIIISILRNWPWPIARNIASHGHGRVIAWGLHTSSLDQSILCI